MRNRVRFGVGLAVAAVLAIAAVAVDGSDREATPRSREGPVFDWAAPAAVDLGGGWSVADAEGDGPFVEVRRDGEVVGFVEYLAFDAEGTLDDHVADFVAAIGEDRANGPVEGYRFTPDAAIRGTAADGPIVRYGFTGTMPDGRPSERTFNWAGIRRGRLVLVSAQANDAGGLFPPEGPALTTEQLESVVGRLDRLVRASGLPL